MSAGTWIVLLKVVDVDVLLGCFVGFRTLEIEDFIVVVVFGLLRVWVVGAMGGVLVACVVCVRW